MDWTIVTSFWVLRTCPTPLNIENQIIGKLAENVFIRPIGIMILMAFKQEEQLVK